MKTINQISLTIISIFTLINSLTNNIQAQTTPLLISNSSNKQSKSPKKPIYSPKPTKPASGGKTGGTRPADCPTTINNQDITAITPQHIGQTIAEHPTFWVYVPYPKASRPVEFTLIDGTGKLLYQTKFLISENPGIISIKLPKNLPPLAIGRKYKWSFYYICNPENREKDRFFSQWIERVALNPNVQKQLTTATEAEKVTLYGANGLWYEMITSLGEMRRKQPQNQEIRENWRDLLTSVGLKDIANEPVTSCCTMKP